MRQDSLRQAQLNDRIERVALSAHALAHDTSIVLSTDAKTDAACRHYLQTNISIANLQAKAQQELGLGTWRPLGHVLLIVSENDVLGTAQAFWGAYLTGNKVTIKARESSHILQFLKTFLALDEEMVHIADWHGGTQDDEVLLQNVDGVVLAGGADLITHFRRVCPPHIRLIEFGPKLSAIAIGSEAELSDVPQIVTGLVDEVGLFLQQVCSSPRFIVVQDENLARSIFQSLQTHLQDLPELSHDTKLVQAVKYAELKLLKNIQKPDGTCLQELAFNADQGWGMTLSQGLSPQLWFEKGFQLVVHDVQDAIEKSMHLWKGSLQTLGLFGCHELKLQGFTRFCPLGDMHQRPLSAPHDGFFELSSLVSFIGKA